MKRRLFCFLMGIIVGLTGLVLCLGAAAPPTYWQDLLQVKPSTEWQKLYGYGEVSFLAHGQWVNRQLLDGQGKVIAAMKKEIEALKAVVDPNEAKQ